MKLKDQRDRLRILVGTLFGSIGLSVVSSSLLSTSYVPILLTSVACASLVGLILEEL